MTSKATLGRLICLSFVTGGCFIDDGRTMGASEATNTSESGSATQDISTTGESSGVTLATATEGGTEGTSVGEATTEAMSTGPTSTTDPGTTSGNATKTSATISTQTGTGTDDPSSGTGFSCEEPFEDCNGNPDDECEANLDESEEHCGMCDNPCAGVCNGGLCQQSQIVFVTANTFSGDLGGLTGADNICNESAADANLPGTYYAWLSTAVNNPVMRFEPTNRPYVMPNNQMVADDWSDLIDGMLLTGINVDQYGSLVATGIACSSTKVWSATTTSGQQASADHCQNWLTSNPNYSGDTGVQGMMDASWTDSPCAPRNCSEEHHLYCFQQQ